MTLRFIIYAEFNPILFTEIVCEVVHTHSCFFALLNPLSLEASCHSRTSPSFQISTTNTSLYILNDNIKAVSGKPQILQINIYLNIQIFYFFQYIFKNVCLLFNYKIFICIQPSMVPRWYCMQPWWTDLTVWLLLSGDTKALQKRK